jgi:hypothetical protein
MGAQAEESQTHFLTAQRGKRQRCLPDQPSLPPLQQFLYTQSKSRHFDSSLDGRRAQHARTESGRIWIAWAKRKGSIKRQGS